MRNLVSEPKLGGYFIFSLRPVHSRPKRTSHEETTRCGHLHPQWTQRGNHYLVLQWPKNHEYSVLSRKDH